MTYKALERPFDKHIEHKQTYGNSLSN